MSIIKEACVDGYEQAKRAWKLGADRIELCADLTVGGVTPSKGTIMQTVKDIPLPIFVLIRPRGGDFYFSDAEYAIMKTDIELCLQLGVAGVVIGGLTQDNLIDSRIQTLISAAGNMQITFHKAFDEIERKCDAIDELIKLGCHRILSSAAGQSVYDNIDLFQSLIKYAGDKIIFVACGGIKSSMLEDVSQKLPTTDFHGKLIVGDLN